MDFKFIDAGHLAIVFRTLVFSNDVKLRAGTLQTKVLLSVFYKAHLITDETPEFQVEGRIVILIILFKSLPIAFSGFMATKKKTSQFFREV